MEGTDSRLVPPADAGTHQIEINNAKRYSMFPIPRGSEESTSSWRSRCPRDRRDHVCPASRPASNVCCGRHCGIRLTDTVRSPDLHRRCGAYVVQTDDLRPVYAGETACALLGLNQSLTGSLTRRREGILMTSRQREMSLPPCPRTSTRSEHGGRQSTLRREPLTALWESHRLRGKGQPGQEMMAGRRGIVPVWGRRPNAGPRANA
jgi:hypothetical protein